MTRGTKAKIKSVSKIAVLCVIGCVISYGISTILKKD